MLEAICLEPLRELLPFPPALLSITAISIAVPVVQSSRPSRSVCGWRRSGARNVLLAPLGRFRQIEAALAACEKIPTDLHHLLTLMLESGTVVGKSISEESAAKLKSIKGTSKSAKQAKQLLQLSGDGAGMAEVRAQACEAVIARAERWRDLRAE